MNPSAKGEVPDPGPAMSFKLPPQPVGWLVIDPGTKLAMYRKPSRFHRWMVRRLTGWKWENA